jgi:hypothetical protein
MRNKTVLLVVILMTTGLICWSDSVSIYTENDVWQYTDGWYTSGQAIEYQSDDLWGLKIAQEIYTPASKGRHVTAQINAADTNNLFISILLFWFDSQL